MASKTAIAAFAALLVAGAAAAAPAGPRAAEENDKIVLSNDDVTVWFQGRKPMLKIFPTGDESGGYAFRFDRVVEFSDANGDGIAQPDEVRAFLNLDAASSWQVETEATDTEATLRLTLEAPLRLRGPANVELPDVPQDRLMGNVTLVFHVFGSEVDVANGTLTVDTTMVKYDFLVNRWTWLDAQADRLALLGELPAQLTEVGDAAATIESNGTAVGMLAWLGEATATTGGETTEVDVVTDVTSDNGKATVQHAFAASGYETLVYDPVLGVVGDEATGGADAGVSEALREAPAAGLAAVAAAAASARILSRRLR